MNLQKDEIPADDEVSLSETLAELRLAAGHESRSVITQVWRANPLRLMPSAIAGLFSDRREVVTRIEVSDVWVYATMGWHQTFLWHRGQVRFCVSPERRRLSIDSFGETVELRCPYFSAAAMTELQTALANRI